MMGDDMAIRSGGMYGQPESQYTLAQPVSSGSSFASSAGSVAGFLKAGIGVASAFATGNLINKQLNRNLMGLQAERAYNVANFEQGIADMVASNKMSFYASGLEQTGTAEDVVRSNEKAKLDELDMMKLNYKLKEQEIKSQKKANRINTYTKVASSMLSAF